MNRLIGYFQTGIDATFDFLFKVVEHFHVMDGKIDLQVPLTSSWDGIVFSTWSPISKCWVLR